MTTPRAASLCAALLSTSLLLTSCSGAPKRPTLASLTANMRDDARAVLLREGVDMRVRLDVRELRAVRAVQALLPQVTQDAIAPALRAVEQAKHAKYLDATRPILANVTLPRDVSLRACLETGTPCLPGQSGGVVRVEALVPTTSPAALKEALARALKGHTHTMHTARGAVRVVIAMTPGAKVARVPDAPKKGRAPALTPALASFLGAQGAAVHVSRDALVRVPGLFQRAHARKLQAAVPAAWRPAHEARATLHHRMLARRARADAAEFEDMTFSLGSDGQTGVWLDQVGTRTVEGVALHRVAHRAEFLPAVRLNDPTIELDWADDLPAATQRAKGLSKLLGAAVGDLNHGAWLIDMTQLTSTLRARRPDLSKGPFPRAMRLAIRMTEPVAGLAGGAPVRGGAALLFTDTKATRSALTSFVRALQRAKGVEARMMRRSDGTLELRVGVRTPLRALFPDATATRVHAGRLKLRLAQFRLDPEIRALTQRIPADRRGPFLKRIEQHDLLTVTHVPTGTHSALRVYLGSERVGPPKAPALSWSARAVRVSPCTSALLALPDDHLATWIREYHPTSPLPRTSAALTAHIAAVEKALGTCGAPGAVHRHALGALHWTRGAIAHRAGDRAAAEASWKAACKQGVKLGCAKDPGATLWPPLQKRAITRAAPTPSGAGAGATTTAPQ